MSMSRRALMRLAAAGGLAAAADRAAQAEGYADAAASRRAQASAPVLLAHQTPIRIGHAALRVRDLAGMSAFYSHLLGLTEVEKTADRVVLGPPGGAPILTLESAPDAPFAAGSEAGLFHIAFLQPSRLDLARWLAHVVRANIELSGFGDHNVSEAVYLDDPEGNGIEVYADRDPAQWTWTDGQVRMGTAQVDIDGLIDLLDDGAPDYGAAPATLGIGHIHLKVGDARRASEFYSREAGLSPTQSNFERGAAFLSSGGYHHHLGANMWMSRGAGRRDPKSLGLSWARFETADATILAAREAAFRASGAVVEAIPGGFEALDPWGTRIQFRQA